MELTIIVDLPATETIDHLHFTVSIKMRQQFKWILIAVICLAVVGMLQFLVCTGIAMARFPEGYSFRDNFISELGIQGYPGHSLFNGSMIFLGVSLLPVFALLAMTDPNHSHSMKITSILGVISALGVIGTGIWTYDRHLVLHHLTVSIWLLPMTYMVISFFYAASHSPYVGVGFLSASLIMVVTMIYVLFTTESSTLQLIQKAVVICGLIWIGFMVAFLWQTGWAIYRNWVEDDGSRQRKEEQYLTTLAGGKHRRS